MDLRNLFLLLKNNNKKMPVETFYNFENVKNMFEITLFTEINKNSLIKIHGTVRILKTSSYL